MILVFKPQSGLNFLPFHIAFHHSNQSMDFPGHFPGDLKDKTLLFQLG
jgi:hypothetical protein